MAQKISNLPVGAKIRDDRTTYHKKPILWVKLEDNHYNSGETVLWSDKVITFKPFDVKEPKNPDRNRSTKGNNRYSHSNIRQWLNSAESSWYQSQHSYDMAPSGANVEVDAYSNEPGFLTNFSSQLMNSLKPIDIKNQLNQIDGKGIYSVSDKVFLLSGSEIAKKWLGDVNEGETFKYFLNDTNRLYKVPTKEAIENTQNKEVVPGESVFWWMRSGGTSLNQTGDVDYFRSINSSSSHFASNSNGVCPCISIDQETLVSSTPDDNGVYRLFEDFNQSPTISGEDTNLGEKSQPFEIQYSVEDKDITDNVAVTEHLNNSLIRRITNANNTNQTLKITSELLNSCPLGETNTIKIYAEDGKGAGTYRNYWFKRTNTPPYFVEENQDLGTVTKAPTITFTAKDDNGDKYLKAKVKINQRVVKTYEQLGNGEQVSFTLDWKDFMQLHHSRKHNLWVEVEDSSGALATLKYTFERDTKKIEIVTNTAPLDIKIKLIVFNANIKLGEGATFLQYACNDFGTGNTWEKIQNGVPYGFTNKHEGEDVIGYKCELTKGTGESEIRSIGGSFI